MNAQRVILPLRRLQLLLVPGARPLKLQQLSLELASCWPLWIATARFKDEILLGDAPTCDAPLGSPGALLSSAATAPRTAASNACITRVALACASSTSVADCISCTSAATQSPTAWWRGGFEVRGSLRRQLCIRRLSLRRLHRAPRLSERAVACFSFCVCSCASPAGSGGGTGGTGGEPIRRSRSGASEETWAGGCGFETCELRPVTAGGGARVRRGAAPRASRSAGHGRSRGVDERESLGAHRRRR